VQAGPRLSGRPFHLRRWINRQSPASSHPPRGHRVAPQDVRDLTYWKVEDWDAGYEILRHSDDGDLAERYEAWQHRVPEHT
jgi:uncharacterized damage-inducible protein DinB